ncbi:autoinducer binding domain-containing protein, partial [Aeromonas sp. CPF2-S1]|nr:autoinducer binding domain-containing protein [Aeromonas sp. CPF2-S1]
MTRDQLLEYLEHFTLVTDGNRLSELIGRFTLGMGYDYYRFALILPMSMQRPKVVLFNQCPDSWVQAYTLNNMLACDPIIQLARRQTLPIYWNRLDEKARFLQEGSMDVMGLAAEFGLRNGISFPLHGAAGENGILSFITRERASSDLMLESSPILSWMSNYIFEAAIRIVRQSMREDDPQEPLTERETECLFWAS